MFDLQSHLDSAVGNRLVTLLHHPGNVRRASLPWFRPHGEWLAVVADEITAEQLHNAFRPIVATNSPRPTIVRAGWLRSFTVSRPLAAYAWAQADARINSNPFAGAPLPSKESQAAYLAYRALRASRILFDRLLSTSDRAAILAELQTLAADLGIDSAETESPKSLLSAIHRAIANLFPFASRQTECDTGAAPLLTVFEELDTLILVLSQPAVNQLAGVNWATLPQIRQTAHRSIMITTAAHLELVARHEMAIAFRTGQYTLQTGCDMMGLVEIQWQDVLRRALRTVVTAATDQLSHCVWGTQNPRLRHGLHAVQNTLLKIQLQYEVLCLLNDLDTQEMTWPALVPGAPTVERLEAIESAVTTWRTLYEQLLDEASHKNGRSNGQFG